LTSRLTMKQPTISYWVKFTKCKRKHRFWVEFKRTIIHDYSLTIIMTKFQPLVSKLQKGFTLPGAEAWLWGWYSEQWAKHSGEEFITASFSIHGDFLVSLLYSFVPDRQWDRFLSHVWMFCPFVNLEVCK
jgi:hypothetical protein